MKVFKLAILAAAVALAFAPAGLAEESEVTLDGSVMCGKCALGKTAECQDVLVVADGEAKGQYWIVKNEVSKSFGHVCDSEKPARVTGSVSEKDGQSWITPTAMAPPADQTGTGSRPGVRAATHSARFRRGREAPLSDSARRPSPRGHRGPRSR